MEKANEELWGGVTASIDARKALAHQPQNTPATLVDRANKRRSGKCIKLVVPAHTSFCFNKKNSLDAEGMY
jgi:hypothetical protein